MKGNSYRNLLALASCLGGSIPEILNWDEIIALANKSLTIPSLAAAIGKLAKTVMQQGFSRQSSINRDVPKC